MKPLVRLRDDPGALPLLRSDLTRAAATPDTGFDVTRGLRALESAIAAPPAPAVSSAAAGKSIVAAAVKGALGGLATVGVAAVASLALDAREPPSLPPQAFTPPAVVAVNTPPSLEPSALPASPPEPAPLPSPKRAPRPSPSQRGASELSLEMEHLARLRALEPADPGEALSVAEEGRRRFPAGLFAQERESLAISALVRLGRRSEAEARARAFITAYPRSHFVERIEELTGVGSK